MDKILFADRGKFQWWSYTVGHGQLLLRSTKSSDRPTQIDVLFKNVSAVSLRAVIDDLEVVETDRDVEGMIGDESILAKVFLVRSRGYEGLVVAGSVVRDEGDHEYHEQSPLLPTFATQADHLRR